jgi:hypothetical protein
MPAPTAVVLIKHVASRYDPDTDAIYTNAIGSPALRALRRWISGSVDNFGPLSLDHCMRLNRVALHGVIIRISFFSDHSALNVLFTRKVRGADVLSILSVRVILAQV